MSNITEQQCTPSYKPQDTPTETYSIIATLCALALNHAGGLIGDKEFHKRVEEETINLLCCVE